MAARRRVLAVDRCCSSAARATCRGHGRQGGRGRHRHATTTRQKKYPNLLKECDVLTEDILAKTVGADPLDIQSTFVGAICRWQALNPAGLIDITRFWFEQGSLDNERKVAEHPEVPGREPSHQRRATRS